METIELFSMRQMSWERSKGELRAILRTYWPLYDNNNNKIDNGYNKALALIEDSLQTFASDALVNLCVGKNKATSHSDGGTT